MQGEHLKRSVMAAILLKALKTPKFRRQLLADPAAPVKVKLKGRVKTVRLAPKQAAIIRTYADSIRRFCKMRDQLNKGSKVVSIISVWP